MPETPGELLAVCGLYCGACYHYRFTLPEGQHLLKSEILRRGRDPHGFACKGCRSDLLSVHPGCSQCEIRACADTKGIVHCGLCDSFPCERLRAFQNNGRVHHLYVVQQLEALREQGPAAWLAAQAQQWTCECGAGFSWYEETCAACGRPIRSYGPDPIML